MSRKQWKLPSNLGAANVQVFAPDGAPVTDRVLKAGGEVVTFDARTLGVFQIRIDPVGDRPTLVPIEVVDLQPGSVQARMPATRYGRRLVREDAPPIVFKSMLGLPKRATISPDLPVRSGTRALVVHQEAPVDIGRRKYLAKDWTPPPPPPPLPLVPDPRVTVGLSVDRFPLAAGGWEPFDSPWPLETRQEEDGWSFEIRRGATDSSLTAENARVRVHVAVERRRTLRLLVPVFMGGVRVTIRPAGDDVGLSVSPLDNNLHVLLQAFHAGSEADPMALLDWVAQTRSHLLDEDPWAQLVFAVLASRKHPDALTLDEASAFADQFPWLADASIITANLHLAQPDPEVGKALSRLVHARRIGAPYFASINALMGTLLVSLAADAREEAHRRAAARELRSWRRRLTFQVAAGPYFAWLMRGGARTRGGVDERYHHILFQGRTLPVGRDSYLEPLSIGVDDTGPLRQALPGPTFDVEN